MEKYSKAVSKLQYKWAFVKYYCGVALDIVEGKTWFDTKEDCKQDAHSQKFKEDLLEYDYGIQYLIRDKPLK